MFNESQVKLRTKMDTVAENVKRRFESIESRRELLKSKQSFDLLAYHKAQEEIRDQKLNKTCIKHERSQQYKREHAKKIGEELAQVI